jgi:CRP/FNR family transcriptional regulator
MQSGVPAALSGPLFADASPRRLAAGEVLFTAGDPGDGCYRLEHGLLKVLVVSPGGEQRIIAILGPGAVVGELAMIDRLPRSASVVALRDSTLRFVSREAFNQAVQAHPETYEALVAILASRLRQADEALVAASFLTVKGRVARALLELAEFAGTRSGPHRVVVEDKISHADLAAMAGVARENVSRVLSVWRRRNLVLTGVSPRYCINDIAALEREMEHYP